MNHLWNNDKAKQMLREMWPDNSLSTIQIANIISREFKLLVPLSKDAIIGKANRLELPPRKIGARCQGDAPKKVRRTTPTASRDESTPCIQTQPKKDRTRLPLPPQVKARRATKPPKLPPLETPPPPDNRARGSEALFALTRDECRWPIGNPQDPNFHFCLKAKQAGSEYCPLHRQLAFQPLPPRRSHTEVFVSNVFISKRFGV